MKTMDFSVKPEGTPYGSRAGEQTRVVPTIEPIVIHCISL